MRIVQEWLECAEGKGEHLLRYRDLSTEDKTQLSSCMFYIIPLLPKEFLLLKYNKSENMSDTEIEWRGRKGKKRCRKREREAEEEVDTER